MNQTKHRDETSLILVVDDDANLRRATVRRLTRAGYQTIEAATGYDALRIAQAEQPDLLLLDVNMPDVDGFEVCRRLKADPALATTYVAMFSGSLTGSENQANGLEAGADEYIARTVSKREFLARVQTMLRLKRVEDELRKARDELERRVQARTVELEQANAALKEEIAQKMRAEREIEKNHRQQSVLNAILRLSMADISLEAQLSQALEEILSIPWLPILPEGAIFLLEGDPPTLRLQTQQNLPPPLVDACAQVSLGQCLCGRAATDDQIVFADCVDGRHDISYDGMPPHGHYCIPILSGEQPIGVLALYLETGHQWDEQERALLEAVGHTLAGIIERKRAESALQQAHDELEIRVEERTAELIEANRKLQREIDERRQIEAAQKELTHQLGERIKELNCLYQFSRTIADPDLSLENVLRQTVAMISPAWQHTDITCARLLFEDQTFETENFQETAWRQREDIYVNGVKQGQITVCYLEEPPDGSAAPFFKEEADLLETIAEQLGSMIERKRAQQQVQWEANLHSALSDLYKPLISPASTIEDIANTVLKQAQALTDSRHGYVSSIDPVTRDHVSHTLTEMLTDSCNVTEVYQNILFPCDDEGNYPALWGYALNTLESFYTNDPSSHPASSSVPEGHIPIEQFLTTPVMLGEELVGQIALANPGRPYTDCDLEAIQRLSEFYALAIQRKRSEEALRQSEQKYRNLFDYANDGIIIFDPDEHHILDANENAAKRLGYAREELLQLSIDDFSPPLPETRRQVIFQELDETGHAIFEHVHRQKDGTEIPVEINSQVIEYEGQKAYQNIVRDITERRQAEIALRRYAEEQAVLYTITSTLARTLDPQELLSDVLGVMLPPLSATVGWIILTGAQTGDASPVIAHWRLSEEEVIRIETIAQCTPECPLKTTPPPKDQSASKLEFVDRCEFLPPELQPKGYEEIACVPLNAAGRTLGVLSIAWADRNVRPEGDRDLLITIGQQIGMALHNAQLYQAARQVDQLQTLNAVSAAAVSSLDPQVVLHKILDATRQALGAEDGSILLKSPETGRLFFAITTEEFSEALQANGVNRQGLDPDRGIAGWVLQHKQPLLVQDVHQDPRWYNDVDSATGFETQSLLCVPLIYHDEVTGVIEIVNKRQGPFTEEDLNLLKAISSIAAVALENARLFNATRTRAEELALLNEIGLALTSTLDFNAVVQAALSQVQRLFHAQGATLAQAMPEEKTLRFVSALVDGQPVDTHDLYLQPGEGILGWALNRRQALLIEDAQTDPRNTERLDRRLNIEPRAMIVAPLLTRERAIGVIGISSDEPGAYTRDELRTLQTLAATLSVALENALLYDELKELLRQKEETQSQLIHAEKISALGRLVASIAHEINNPLQAVQGCLTLAEEELESERRPDKLMRYMQIADGEVERISAIVSRTRDFYRPSREGAQSIDVHNILESVIELANKQLQHSDIQVEREWIEEIPAIRANADQIRQVFLNMVINAIDAMPEGGVLNIETSVEEKSLNNEAPETTVCIRFSDTGVGIAAENLPRLFEPFYTTKEYGSGLGLSISYGIIQNHRGRIQVESQVGLGTTFTIWLPVQKSQRQS
jgi:two-component system, NtrC family, sensor kinase